MASLFDRKVEEGWLQELIRKNPDLLPVPDIEPAYAPLVSIECEVPTQVGSIDNLYVSPTGLLTIVETKLWRNPEARRQVVGQIIDYAKEVRVLGLRRRMRLGLIALEARVLPYFLSGALYLFSCLA